MKKLFLFSLLASFILAKDVDIKVAKMHCPLCTTMIKKAIKKVDGVEKVKVRLNTKIAKIKFDESKASLKDILKAIDTTGYKGELIE